MSFSADSSDSEWKATKVKAEKIIKNEKKYYQQRFVERWLDRFKPWLARDTLDPEKPFCKACRCRLNCNKCHLQRHERTAKHHANLESYLSALGLLSSKQNLGQRKERKKTIKIPATSEDFEESKFESVYMDSDYINEKRREDDDFSATQETLHDFPFVQAEHEVEMQNDIPHLYENIDKLSERGQPLRNQQKRDAKSLFMQIQKDKNDLMASLNELCDQSPKKEKNHVDLFFESVSSTVKTLSPKLIAETKMRVSQLICEVELRGITENESNVAAAAVANNTASSTVLLTAPLGGAYLINHGPATNGNNQVGSSQNDTTYEATR